MEKGGIARRQAEVSANAQAEVSANAQAEVGANAQSEVGANAQSEVGANAQAEVSANAQAEVGANAQSEVGANAQAEVSANAQSGCTMANAAKWHRSPPGRGECQGGRTVRAGDGCPAVVPAAAEGRRNLPASGGMRAAVVPAAPS